MPTTKLLSIKSLKLDLHNFRTIPQSDEVNAIHAMISIDPEWFYALMESLLSDGYHPTENIIVLNNDKKKDTFLVKEGNRRIGALKIIHGYVHLSEDTLPSHLQEQIANIPKGWKRINNEVPCAIFLPEEADTVDKIIALIHGKGEKAGRRVWKAIARARHSRDKNGAKEPALDLLEKYLAEGKNISADQRERWGGDYPLTVLDEAIKRLVPRLGLSSSSELVEKYPGKIKQRTALENILRDVGGGEIDFPKLRNVKEDYLQVNYGIPNISTTKDSATGSDSTSANAKRTQTTPNSPQNSQNESPAPNNKKTKSVPSNDPRAVLRALKSFTPKGNHREKLVALLNEIKKLSLANHPHAFCFLLRSMYEISAKAYCLDHNVSGGPKCTKSNGEDRALVEILREITKHLTNNNKDIQMKKRLHGAMTELGKGESILSVTSMNQLVHNPNFSINETHISTMFGNIFPLLEEINR